MTTLVCNKEELQGDLQFTGGNNKFKGKTKVYQFKAHPDTYPCDFIVGFCGIAAEIVPAVSYFSDPDSYKKPPRAKISGLVLTAQKKIFIFEDDYTKWLIVDQPFYAMGSGAPYALAAMEVGATPKEAIKVAMKHDPLTGMGIRGYKLKF